MPRSRHRKKKPGRRHLVAEMPAPPSDEKMSAVILDLIEPYLEHADNDAAFEKLVALGVVAWNVALLPESEREAELDKFAAAALKSVRPTKTTVVGWLRRRLGFPGPGAGDSEPDLVRDFKATVRQLVGRKLRLFPENRRFILDVRASGTGDQGRLLVTSTLKHVGG